MPTNQSPSSESTSSSTNEDPLLNDTAPPDPATPDTPSDPETASQGEASSDAERIAELEAQVEALEAERDAINDQFLRKAAELENTRKRLSQQIERQFEAGKVEAISAVLGTIDDLERSMDAASQFEENDNPKAAYESLRDGLNLVYENFHAALNEIDVERIDAEGKPFDENKHEAMMQQPAEDAESGTVLNEIRAGYQMGDRVVRHAQVVVAK
ncbi:MAG: nucleotide exchange factor GrpE [Longimonas sp.]|uniref:nucleotide exchange factor GrpE n=1 Tax=Longimonas sp. TaxID=2039626 RepID=UPI0039770F72